MLFFVSVLMLLLLLFLLLHTFDFFFFSLFLAYIEILILGAFREIRDREMGYLLPCNYLVSILTNACVFAVFIRNLYVS